VLSHDHFKALLDEFFAAVSFESGERPAYAKLRDLFTADGRLVNTAPQPPDSAGVEEFIEPRQRMVDSGELTAFLERELAASQDVFGNVAHRLSNYEKRGTKNGVTFEARGVISTQFVNTPSGWRISSMAWDDERPGLELPDAL